MKKIITAVLVLIFGFIGTAVAQQGYNPCDDIYVKVGIDTLVGAFAGALMNRNQGAGIGAGAAVAGSYTMRQAACENFKQQMYMQQQQMQQQAMQQAQQNAPRCQYWEQNGQTYRSCTETVAGSWRR